MIDFKSDTLINYFCIFNDVYANEVTRLLPQGSTTQCCHSVILESQCYYTVFRPANYVKNYMVIVLSQCDFRITVLPHCV